MRKGLRNNKFNKNYGIEMLRILRFAWPTNLDTDRDNKRKFLNIEYREELKIESSDLWSGRNCSCDIL